MKNLKGWFNHVMSNSRESELRNNVLHAVKAYFDEIYQMRFVETEEPKTYIPYAGRVFDENEMLALTNSTLDFWLTGGKNTVLFEKKLAQWLGVRYSLLVNSGSSANLLAFMTLTAWELGDRRIQRGDEVITVAAGFPTTVAPIVQYGAVPVFLDIEIPSYNLDVRQLDDALSPRTKAVMIAHTMGNPFDVTTIKRFCERHHLWLIEDNCDALGSRVLNNDTWKLTGTFGDIATSSFYPPHHITMGEGGAVYTDNPLLKKIAESFRDWGRDCWCEAGRDNTCGIRFKHQLGQLPYGYDHKYIYSHFGYNLKATDMQASIGMAQLDKLEYFIEKRKENWNYLREKLDQYQHLFYLPEIQGETDPSWFSFVLTLKKEAPFSRNEIVSYLEKKGVQTRMLFAGNLIKHPCFDEIRNDFTKYRLIGDLENTNYITENTFVVGVYPGLFRVDLDKIVLEVRNFIENAV